MGFLDRMDCFYCLSSWAKWIIRSFFMLGVLLAPYSLAGCTIRVGFLSYMSSGIYESFHTRPWFRLHLGQSKVLSELPSIPQVSIVPRRLRPGVFGLLILSYLRGISKRFLSLRLFWFPWGVSYEVIAFYSFMTTCQLIIKETFNFVCIIALMCGMWPLCRMCHRSILVVSIL